MEQRFLFHIESMGVSLEKLPSGNLQFSMVDYQNQTLSFEMNKASAGKLLNGIQAYLESLKEE